MSDPADRYRRPGPQDVPEPSVLAERAEFDTMSAQSQEDVAASAERWRTGLAGLTTVVTGGLLLKGPADAADLDTVWRVVLTGLFGLGIAASISGFWWALRASAGVPTTLRYDDLQRAYGTVRLYRLALAQRASRELRRARRAALVAVVLLAVAILTWWWAPPKPGPTVTVTTGAGQSCGVIADSDGGGLRLTIDGEPARTTIPWIGITSIKAVAQC
jgi:hypothetical protein